MNSINVKDIFDIIYLTASYTQDDSDYHFGKCCLEIRKKIPNITNEEIRELYVRYDDFNYEIDYFN